MTEFGITPRLQGAQLVIGGRQGLDAMVDVADTATSQLDVDLFGGRSYAFDKIAVERPGVDQLYLADPEVTKPVRTRVANAGGQLAMVGEEPAKNHAKSVVADGQRAVVTTAAFAPRTPERYEVTATFSGDSARAMADVTRARAAGDGDAIRATAEAARRHGIVLNDPAHGVWHLSEEVKGLVAGAKDRLIVATKRLEEPGIVQDIEDAKGRGVVVSKAKLNSNATPLHANIVIADNAAYVGSGHLTKRVLTGGGSNGRISRELGVMIEDPKLVDELARSLERQGYIGPLDANGIPKATGMTTKLKVGLAAGGAVALAAAATGVVILMRNGNEQK